MKTLPGAPIPELPSLLQVKDRLTFVYIEHCIVNRQDSAITVTDQRGTVHIPSAILSVLLLGPGTDVSHRAIELVAQSGTTLVWVGEQGVRYYACGKPLTHSSTLLIRQAELVSNVRSRVAVARKMYQMRFGGEDVSQLTMQQLRGREGSRVRNVYRKWSEQTGVPWNGREYVPEDYEGGDMINQALSAAHACLYGLALSVLVSLGLSPGLGFVHTGHELSFVYDFADLYKADVTIPIAFLETAKHPQKIETEVRHAARDIFVSTNLIERMVGDVHALFSTGEDGSLEAPQVDILRLWDDKEGLVKAGVSYGPSDGSHAYADVLERDAGYGTIMDE